MSLLNRVKQQNINQGIKSFHSTPGALLLDVRSKEEFDLEHIPELMVPVTNVQSDYQPQILATLECDLNTAIFSAS